MSFLSDVFEGNFGNLGRDLTQAPSSFARHPTEMLEAAGAAALPFAGLGLGALAGGAEGLFGAGAGAAEGAGSALGFAGDVVPTLEGSSAISSFADPTLGAAGYSGDIATDAYAPFAGVSDAPVGGGDVFGGAAQGVNPVASSNPFGDLVSAAPGTGGKGTDALDAVNAFAAQDPGALPGGSTVSDVVGGGGGPTSGSPSFWDTLTKGVQNAPGNAVKQIAQNPLGIAAGIGALGYSMYQGQKTLPNVQALQNQANQLTAQGQQFMQFLQQGTLPPALKASVDQASNAAKARIIANHAASGQSTDPTQNSALAQELAAADQNALIAVGQLGEQLFTAGQSEVGLSSQIYAKLVQIDQQQSANMGKAIASFASALGTGAVAGSRAF